MTMTHIETHSQTNISTELTEANTVLDSMNNHNCTADSNLPRPHGLFQGAQFSNCTFNISFKSN